MDAHLIPEAARDAGLPAVELTIEEVEPAHLLANEARGELLRVGFTDDEVDGWAREFVAQFGGGSAEDLIAWIEREEQSSAEPQPAFVAPRRIRVTTNLRAHVLLVERARRSCREAGSDLR